MSCTWNICKYSSSSQTTPRRKTIRRASDATWANTTVQNGRSEEQQYSFKAKFCYLLSVVMWTE